MKKTWKDILEDMLHESVVEPGIIIFRHANISKDYAWLSRYFTVIILEQRFITVLLAVVQTPEIIKHASAGYRAIYLILSWIIQRLTNCVYPIGSSYSWYSLIHPLRKI
jgi:hypothetical protein